MSTEEKNTASQGSHADYTDPMLTTPAEEVVRLRVYAIPRNAQAGFKQVAQISIPSRNQPSVFSAEILDYIPDLSPEERTELAEKVAAIRKAAGLDGSAMTKLRHSNGRLTVDGKDINRQVTQGLLRYITIEGRIEAHRIHSLTSLCEEAEPLTQKILHHEDVLTTMQEIETARSQYQRLHGKEKEKYHKSNLSKNGYDLNNNPVAQYLRTIRQTLWYEGPEKTLNTAMRTLTSLQKLQQDHLSAAQKLAARAQEKNRARLETKKKKEQESVSEYAMHKFLSDEDFDRVSDASDLSTTKQNHEAIKEKIKIIMKAAGLDGPDIGQGLDLSALPEDSLATIILQTKEQIKKDLSAYLDVESPGATDRIDHLFDLARKTESALTQLSILPARQRNLEFLSTVRKKISEMEKDPAYSDSQKHQFRVESFTDCGADINHDLFEQEAMRRRLEIWSCGVDTLTHHFDLVVTKLEEIANSAYANDISSQPASPDTNLPTDEKLKIIMKAAGVGGPAPGEGFDLSKIPENSGGARAITAYATIKDNILDYIRMGESGDEGRINLLLTVAAKTNAAQAGFENLPIRQRNRNMLLKDQKSLKGYPPEKRKNDCQRCFEKTGIDLNRNITDQMNDHERQDFWQFGPEALINDFDSLFDSLKSRLDDLGQKHLSPTQRRTLSSQQKDQQRLRESLERRQKNQRNPSSHGGSSETVPVFKAPEDPQIKRREQLGTLLSTALNATDDLREKLQHEKSSAPSNLEHMEEQAILLEAATEDFEALRAAVLSLQDRKQELLAGLEAAGQDVSSSMSLEIEAILNKTTAAEPAGHDKDISPPGLASGTAGNNDLDEFRGDFPDLCAQIEDAREGLLEISNTYRAAQAENARLLVSARQAESSMARTATQTEKLKNYRTDLTIELEQLAYRLENPTANIGVKAAFYESAKYPPLSQIQTWADDHLDKSRVLVLTPAFKRAAASQYSNPDLVFQALEFLQNECWDMHFADGSDPATRAKTKANYERRLNELGLSDVSSKIEKINPKFRDKYTVWADGTKHALKHHFKLSTSRDARNCFRLYYAYDDINRRIIVGHMPDHLPTMIS